MTLFDHLNNIYINKTPWEKLSDADKKTWNSFMTNKYISMLGGNECCIVDAVQKYQFEPKIQYNLYKNIFPKERRNATYIKSAGTSKSNAALIEILAGVYEMSQREVEEYIDMISIEEKTHILTGLGYETKEIRKLVK